MINLRRLRKILRHLLPEGLKRRVRKRLFGFRSSHAGGDWALSTCAPKVELRGKGVTAVFPDTSQASLTYHCFDNGDSIDELSGFVDHAKNGPGMLIDVGAAEGLFSTLYCLANSDNRAIAYEPSGKMYEHLQSTVELNKLSDRLTTVNAAVGQSNGIVAGNISSSGMLVIDEATSGSIELRILSLDGELETLGIPTTIKIDVEGYEGEVLRGAQRLLATHRPMMFLEFHLDILEHRNIQVLDLLDILVGLGYQFETSRGVRLTAKQIANSPKAIIRFVARVNPAVT